MRSWTLALVAVLASGCGDSAAPTPPAAAQLQLKDGSGQTATAGSVLQQPLRVAALDAADGPVAGVEVHWSVVTGGGTLAGASVTTGADGIADTMYTLGATVGEQRIEAEVQGLAGSPVVFTETATAGEPAGNALVVAGGGNNTPERFTSDLWVHGSSAYTGTWGTRVAAGNVVKVWQLGAGGAPALADSMKIPGIGTVSDLEVSADGALLLVTGEYGDNAGLYLYSLASPGHPALVGSYPVPAANGGLHTGTFAELNGRRYVFAARDPGGSTPAMMIFDVSDPAHPVVVSTVEVPADYGAHDQLVRDGLAFAFIWNSGFRIYDVGNGIRGGSPSHPVLVSSFVTSATGSDAPEVHNGWWFHNPNTGEKRYLFIGQEGPGGIGSSSRGDIHVVDISSLTNPVEVAFFHLPDAGTHNFWMDEQKQVLYAAYYNGGIVALDVSGTLAGDLASREIARLKPGGDGNTYVWGVQLANGSLYASDMLSGLWQIGRVGPSLQ
jgi:hypothetical protein